MNLDALSEIQSELSTLSKPRQYVISSMFIHQCFRELTADEREQLFFISGAEVSGICVLDQKTEFAHHRRTLTGVEGEPTATHAALLRLERFGHRLLAHFHSHPGPGIGNTIPSGTDRNFQERLERGGFPTVAAIFSRDGFIRFFRVDGDLQISVHGTGVIDRNEVTYTIPMLKLRRRIRELKASLRQQLGKEIEFGPARSAELPLVEDDIKLEGVGSENETIGNAILAQLCSRDLGKRTRRGC